MTHQLTAPHNNFVDKRRSYKDDFENRNATGPVMFTANAGGTTTTIVGANATPATNTNMLRIDEEFKLFTAAGVLKEEKVFRVTANVVAGSTTLTFTPAAAVATASTDICKLVGDEHIDSTGNMDRRLVALGFSALYVSKLTENDKMYQLRVSDDPDGIK
jgi:hypothetical protein